MTSQDEAGDLPPDAALERARYSSRQLAAYFLKLGTIGFGGPVALVEYMRRDLVEEPGWIPEAEYRDGLALAQLAPGPLAAQLAMYLGFVHYRVLGATLVGLSFILPSFLMVVALGWAYTVYGGLPWVEAVFYGVGAAVIGIIAHSAYRITRKSVGRSWLLRAIYLAAAAVTVVTETEWVLLFIAAGIIVWLVKAPPRRWRVPKALGAALIGPAGSLGLAADPARAGLLAKIFLFFLYAGSFVFGSGLAIVPFLYGGVVKDHHWLTEHQFIDAVAVALITPGPVVITTGFIGFLIAGPAGACVAAAATFLPAYLFTILPAPVLQAVRQAPGHRRVRGGSDHRGHRRDQRSGGGARAPVDRRPADRPACARDASRAVEGESPRTGDRAGRRGARAGPLPPVPRMTLHRRSLSS